MSDKIEDQIQLWLDDIQPDILAELRSRRVEEAGFGAGPSCVGGYTTHYPEPVPFADALRWLARYGRVMRKGHLHLADRSVAWFEPLRFVRWDREPREAPQVGVTARHSSSALPERN